MMVGRKLAEVELVNGLDLVGECVRAHWNVRGQHRDWLPAQGVSPVAIYCPPPRLHGHFGVTRAQFHSDLYEPAPEGKPVILMGVNEHPEEGLIDIVAFEPSNPARWYLRLGNAAALGLHNARLALFEEAPVFVHTTPLDWLRADCRGCVVLDWTRDVLSHLDGYGVLAADAETQQRLQKNFQQHIHIPEVRVVGRRNAA